MRKIQCRFALWQVARQAVAAVLGFQIRHIGLNAQNPQQGTHSVARAKGTWENAALHLMKALPRTTIKDSCAFCISKTRWQALACA